LEGEKATFPFQVAPKYEATWRVRQLGGGVREEGEG